MSNIKPASPFEILSTADKSPTLRLNGAEPMHSFQGAFSESLYIYKPVIKKSLKLENPRILSLGLGLAYNEIIAGGVALSKGVDQFTLHSFETENWLVSFFKGWLRGETNPLSPCYDQILALTCKEFDLKKKKLFQFLNEMDLNLNGTLPESSEDKFHGILYDAFSFRTNPELWTEKHFTNFIEHFCHETCYFSTYAATSVLKKTLKKHGFKIKKKSGFALKRESTFAFR